MRRHDRAAGELAPVSGGRLAGSLARSTTVTMTSEDRQCGQCGETFPVGTSHGHGSGWHPDFQATEVYDDGPAYFVRKRP